MAALQATAMAALPCAVEASDGSVVAPDVPALCRADIDFLPAFLTANDAGVQSMVEAGHSPIDPSQTAYYEGLAVSVSSEEECDALVQKYVSGIRRGHLEIRPELGRAASRPEPGAVVRLDFPDDRIALLKISSFDQGTGVLLKKTLDQGKNRLRTHPLWIIDVRGNSGGSDSEWDALLRRVGVARVAGFSGEFLATPDNVQAFSQLLDSNRASAQVQDKLRELLARMQRARPGSYVQLFDQVKRGSLMTFEYPATAVVPAKVLVMMDGGCASSCEQFLLSVRQGWRVKLFGQNSAGILDYSNALPHMLPSNRRWVYYATSRSARLPDFPVDGRGLSPDVLYPAPATSDEGLQELKAAEDFLRSGDRRH